MCLTIKPSGQMDVQAQDTIQRLNQYPDISKIINFSQIRLKFTDDFGWVLRIDTATKDDAVVLFQTYGRIISKTAQASNVSRIEIKSGEEDLYNFSPKFRLSWL